MSTYDPLQSKDDPLAAPIFDTEETEPVSTGAWKPEHGYPAMKDVVRLWTDDAGIPTRLRIALTWRDKLKGRRLEEPINTCLRMAVSMCHRPTVPPLATPSPAGKAMTIEALQQLHQRSIDLAALAQELNARAETETTHWSGGGGIGQAADGSVVATMSADGYLTYIHVDESWAQKSRVVEISKAVIDACNQAKANFEPGEIVLGEKGRLAAEQLDIFNQYRALMLRGFN